MFVRCRKRFATSSIKKNENLFCVVVAFCNMKKENSSIFIVNNKEDIIFYN